MSQEKDILEQLKAVRKIKGYSYQAIADKTEEIGKAVSLSTVKRVFAEGSTLDAFRYDTSIQPIAVVLLGIGEETEPPGQASAQREAEYYTTIEALKSVVAIKNETIAAMQKALDDKTAECEHLKDEHRADIDALKHEHDAREAETRRAYQQGIADRNRTNRNLSIALFVLLAIVLGIILLDLCLGGYGWFRRAAVDFMLAL
uniref:HTH cro/C1-type domain-containing protein n=1 Tax=Dulem virus 33 TaxID=3145751 RepID=A0AAU8B8S4_9CAUD